MVFGYDRYGQAPSTTPHKSHSSSLKIDTQHIRWKVASPHTFLLLYVRVNSLFELLLLLERVQAGQKFQREGRPSVETNSSSHLWLVVEVDSSAQHLKLSCETTLCTSSSMPTTKFLSLLCSTRNIVMQI